MEFALVAQEVEWRIAKTLGEPSLAIATRNRSTAAMANGDPSRAQALLEEAVTAHRKSGKGLGVAVAQSFLSEAMFDNGNIVGAAAQVREAIRGFAGVAAWVQMSSNLIRLSAMATSHLPEISTRLLAAAVSILNSAGITPRPDDTSTIDRTTTETRSALGEAAFDMAWTSGSNLDLDAVFSVVDEAVVALAQPAVDPAHGLSPRETEVLRLVAAGKSNRAIAEDSVDQRTDGGKPRVPHSRQAQTRIPHRRSGLGRAPRPRLSVVIDSPAR